MLIVVAVIVIILGVKGNGDQVTYLYYPIQAPAATGDNPLLLPKCTELIRSTDFPHLNHTPIC